MMNRPAIVAMLFVSLFPVVGWGDDFATRAEKLFRSENLVAWCIVPFDARRRGPQERAEMLSRMKFQKFAYDWRAEHIPTFDAEIAALANARIELTAFWFPAGLNSEANAILAALRRNNVHTQLWVTMGDPAPAAKTPEEKVSAAVKQLAPVVDAAADAGCQVGLYNHGGWFGEPENQIEIVKAFQNRQPPRGNVGLVYNQHHGHAHLTRFRELLAKMKPHLYSLNLNGMNADGEARGQKILQLGQGELDLELLKIIVESGYEGPIGILGHTQDDAELRLQDNLDGLAWLVRQLQGKPAGDRPQPRTPVPGKTASATIRPSHSAPPAEYDAAWIAAWMNQTERDGEMIRGMDVFLSQKFACISCHKVGEKGGLVGPDLSDVGRRLKPAEIAEALAWPRRQVKPEFTAWRLLLDDGRNLQGYLVGESAQEVELLDPATQQKHRVPADTIEERHAVGTLMPEGLLAAMSSQQRHDLLRFLLALGHDPQLPAKLHQLHTPAEFTYTREPLEKEHWPAWQEPVNRDRVYDFYRREALFFREQKTRPHLLPPFPGLDGGRQGHWGNQNEGTWRDDRWNHTDAGSLLCGVFHGPAGVVPKAVCVRVGERNELAVCFNPQTMQYDALWKDGFFRFSPVRHGFMDGLRPAGTMLTAPEKITHAQPLVYRGFFRSGQRVVFHYRAGDTEYLDAPWVRDGQFIRDVQPVAQHPLRHVLEGGTPQWPQTFETQGRTTSHEPYTVDTIPLPFDNPWKSLLFIGDHAFNSTGTAFLCTMTGDVWCAEGIDRDLTKITWRRYASGLHQPLGMWIDGQDQLYILGRDQITQLQDINGDGEADFYRCVSQAMETSPGGHDYTTGLVRDGEGNFYTSSGKQGLLRITADGSRAEVLATGFRNPDGIGICSDGALTVPCSEGDWTPASMLCLVKRGQPLAHFGWGGPRNKQPPSLPLVYLPRGLDNSAGGQVTVPDDRWGPLRGQLLHFSYGQGSHFLVLRDEVAGQPQGAIVPLRSEFRSGSHRGKFNPVDGQLYVSGMAGWGSYTSDDGCFQRVRYTGGKVQLPKSFHVHENGIIISFTSPIDRSLASCGENHFAHAWNYRYSPAYGSPELSPSHAGVPGHDWLDIAGAHVIDDHTLFLELPGLQPVNQLHLLLQAYAGSPCELFITVHRLDAPFTRYDGYRPREKTIAAHPLGVDMLSLTADFRPNPFRQPLPEATSLAIAAGRNLSFATRELNVKAGANVKLEFTNPDVVPHNWVLVQKGMLSDVAGEVNRLIADPAAYTRHYVPEHKGVLAWTDIVQPGGKFVIHFKAPSAPGRYPYLCTFPGHSMAMTGELVVEAPGK